MKLSIFDRPEYRLATRISVSVMLALIAVVSITALLGDRADQKRVQDYFSRRAGMLSMGRGEFSRIVSQESRETLENRLRDRRFLPQNLRSVVVVFRDGPPLVVGPLESANLPEGFFGSMPPGRITVRKIDGEGFAFFPAAVGRDRSVVLYEPEEFLVGPRAAILASMFFGILSFSFILFFISLSFARKVIRPIEEIAERERAYARHIAHELKTPLAVAKSDLQLALAEKGTSEERIRSAVSEIGAMRDTVDDLLLFSSSGSLAKTMPVSPVKILQELISKTESADRFEITKDSDAPETVDSDPKLLSTLFRNLVSNAIVHAPEDSKVSVKFAKDGFSFSNPAPNADPKVIRHAFDAFVGTPGKGSGIGLSLVKRIAEAHGWKASMRLENGTVTVTVSCP